MGESRAGGEQEQENDDATIEAAMMQSEDAIRQSVNEGKNARKNGCGVLGVERWAQCCY